MSEVQEATQLDYDEITRAICNYPKEFKQKIASNEYPVVTENNTLCINFPIFELENLFNQINQLKSALKKSKSKRKRK